LLASFATEPKVRRFKPGEGQLIFKGYESPWHYFLRRGSRLFHVVRVYGMLKTPASMKEILRRRNSRPFFRKVFFSSSTRCLCWYLPESYNGRIRNDQNSDGNNRSKMVAVHGTSCAIKLRDSNSNSIISVQNCYSAMVNKQPLRNCVFFD
jgi:hypothetical protein